MELPKRIFLTKLVKDLKRKSKSKRNIAVAIILALFVASFYYFILRDLPLPTKLGSSSNPQSTLIYDRNGKLLYNIYDKKNQSFIPLSSIPKYMQEATIAIEDRSFYQHGAIDLRGIARASLSIVLHQQIQGGSTLTQQLVKNSLLTQQQTILRKIKEVILAFATEVVYSKNQILEMYLNQTPYGGTSYGVEAASETYFGKPAKDLDLAQSALLAGLPQAPTQFSPFGAHPEEGKDRQVVVLQAMQDQGYITKTQEQAAEKEDLKYKKFTNNIQAPHFVLYIKDLLIAKYGEQRVEEGGLKVITSLDLDIQNFAQEAVATEVDKLPTYYHVTNGASLVTDPANGEILAMVGSKDYFDNAIAGNVNIATSLRQPGSSIKPINYAVGLLNGYNAATTFIDQPICFPNQGGQNYCPLNYDGKWHGLVQLRYALGNSFNIPAVKMLELNGVNAMVATASAMGITTFTNPERYGLSLTLGGAEVKMVDMATAFGVFANSGYRIDLHPILKVTDKNGKVLEEYKPPLSPIFGQKVLPDGVAFIISDILADNGARLMEFGDNSELKITGQTVSVKTGTTNDFRDNWTIGYTPSLLVAAWVGNDDNSQMSGLVSGITGAAPIWNDIMSRLLKDRVPEPISRPPGIIQKAVCSDTGLPTAVAGATCPTRFEYILKGTENTRGQITTGDTQVDKTTQDLPAKGQTDNLETKTETVYTDPTGDKFCTTCPHPNLMPSPTPTPTH
ncbi:MAG TPA: PBP1A family penicillin-binding protein [Patescibacteria group bacterium]|jgi:1A family penicillin-binding protein|nr:PBP1A family penicillin-binding protein [Patescibacteria group bacterium]